MIRAAVLVMAMPLVACAQLALFSVNGATETAVGASFSVGQIAAGASVDSLFRARNTGTAALTISKLSLSGSGFSIVNTSSIPYIIAPGAFMPIDVHFSGGPPASYSANFQINSISVLIQALTVPAASVNIAPPCAAGFDFGTVQIGQKVSCIVSLKNQNTQPLTISKIAVSGSGFQIQSPVSTPDTLAAGGMAAFTINFAPTSAATYAGLLTVDTQSYPLFGTGLNAPMPTPVLSFDSGVPASGQQRTISMSLPASAPSAASGSVNLSFQPDTKVVASDPAVAFLNGARSVGFSIQPGDTQIKLGGQAGAMFQTGTTSGKITFTVSINVALTGDPTTTMTIPPAPINIEHASAIARAGALDVQVFNGFDNTYSAGPMSFTFYDTHGNVIGSGAMQADFTKDFSTYFAANGSAFQMLVTFPVSGQANQIGFVNFQMTNDIGTTTLSQRLTVINDTGQ